MKKLAVLLASIAALLLAAAPASAHGGEGQVEITSVTREGDEVTVVAHLTYVEDGHGVPDATVTVVVDDGTPVPMEAGAGEGDYQATVTAAPGAAIRVTSVEPATGAEAVAPDAGADATTTTAAGSTTTGATTGDAPTTQAPAETAPEPNGIDEEPEDGGGNVVVLVVLVVVIAAAIAAAFVLRRKKPGEV